MNTEDIVPAKLFSAIKFLVDQQYDQRITNMQYGGNLINSQLFNQLSSQLFSGQSTVYIIIIAVMMLIIFTLALIICFKNNSSSGVSNEGTYGGINNGNNTNNNSNNNNNNNGNRQIEYVYVRQPVNYNPIEYRRNTTTEYPLLMN